MPNNDTPAIGGAAVDPAVVPPGAGEPVAVPPVIAGPVAVAPPPPADQLAAAAKVVAANAAAVTARTGISETLDATVPAEEAAPSLASVGEKKYDADQYRDRTRSYIAYWLLLLLTVVVVSSFGMLAAVKAGQVTFENLKSVLELILGPIVALVSAATGFYFGSQQSNRQQ